MNKKNKKTGGDGLAIAGLVGLGLGALGSWVWGKIKEEDQEKEQEKQLNLLKREIAQKNREMESEKNQKEPPKETGCLQTDSDNLLENPNFSCPISNVIMDDPIIVTKCGHTFQKEALEAWLKKKKTCPLCLIEIGDNDIKPNYTMKAIVSDLTKKK